MSAFASCWHTVTKASVRVVPLHKSRHRAFDSRGDRSPCGQAARAFAEAVFRSVEFIVQPDAHSAAADINDAVSALRLVLQLGQVPCFLSDPNGSIERRAITVGRRNQNPQANRALLFKAPREVVGLFILVVEPETLVQ